MKGHTSSRTPSAIVRSNLPTLVTPHGLIPRVLPIDFLHKNLYLWTFSKESDIRQVWDNLSEYLMILITDSIVCSLIHTPLYVLYFLMMMYLYIRDSCLKHQWFSELPISMTTTATGSTLPLSKLPVLL